MFNLLVAGLLTIISYFDVLIHPYGKWEAGKPAAFTYRAPVSQDTLSDELQSLLKRKGKVEQRFIVRRGDTVTEADLAELQRLRPERGRMNPQLMIGVLGFYFLCLTFFNLLVRRYGRHLFLRFRALGTIYLSLVAAAIISRLLLDFTQASVYAVPTAFAAILFTPLLGQNLGFTLHLLLVAIIAPMLRFTPGVVLIPLVSGWMAVLLLVRESGPIRMLLASCGGALIGALFLAGLDLFSPHHLLLSLHLESDLTGILMGVLGAGLVAVVLSYPATWAFGLVPASRLRNLLDMDHPLLKDLAEKAPGTFQHSLAMANMAEKVADDIGADARLVRAGAYYHDIGKMSESKYFIENQNGENPHNQIPPDVSAGKLRSHIELGTTIARAASLPERIIDFIVEHHGRSTMEYFLDKAYRTSGFVPDPEKFRYQGRNPTSRETGILMVVDAVEAASRTLNDPAPEDIEALVRQIIFSKLLHGYLDESGLTTKDLKQVGISLIKLLQAHFHVRVEYPWQKKDGERPPLKIVPDAHAGVTITQRMRVVEPISMPPPPKPASPPSNPALPAAAPATERPEGDPPKSG